MKNVLRKAGVHRKDTILYKGVHMLAYVDNIDSIGRSKRNHTAIFNSTRHKSVDISLESKITADNYTFVVVNESDYLRQTETISIQRSRISHVKKNYFYFSKSENERENMEKSLAHN